MQDDEKRIALQDAWLEEVAKKRASDRKEILAEIERLEVKASVLLGKATDLCDVHGISHYFGISPLSQRYDGEGAEEKIDQLVVEARKTNLFDNEDEEDVKQIICEFLDESRNEYGETGWEHSAVC